MSQRQKMKWYSFVDKLMPQGTRRRRWYDLGIIGRRTIANEGWNSFLWKYKQHRRKVKQETTHLGEVFLQKNAKKSEEYIEGYIHFPTPRKFRILYVIGILPGDPSNRYRVYNFEEYLSDFEIETKHINQSEIFGKLGEILTFDIIVLFRVALDDNLTRLISLCKKLNIPTIFDVDDYVFEPKIATVEHIDGIRLLPKEEQSLYIEGVKKYRKTLLSCNYFTTTTEYLAEKGKVLGKKVFVLRNGLNREIIEISKRVKKDYKKENNFIWIGYFSGTKTHQKDFAVVVGAIKRILSKYSNVKLLIGGYLDSKEFSELDEFKDRMETLPWVSWQKLPFNITKADVNVVPLELGNPFSEAKSELKYFEAALLKIPTVASPTDAFRYAIKDGVNGFLAKDENEWYTKLETLIKNEELRRKMGERAYEHSLRVYSTSSLAKVLLDTYKKILVDYNRSKGISADSLSIGIILPPPFTGSGGHMRIFEIAKNLSDMNHKVKVYITDSLQFRTGYEVEKLIQRDFIEPNFKVVLGVDKITSCDVLIATHWSTAYIVHKYRNRATKTFYFVQDYEPYFHPMSEDYINADMSYRLMDVIVTYGRWCYELLKGNNKIFSRQKIYWIPFHVNKTICHPIDNVEKKQNRVLFFARPDMPRRLYGLGIEVLKIVASKKPDVEIIFYGSKNVNSSEIPFKHTNLGHLPTQHDLVKLYNSATVGLLFTTTNPSMTSFEMMACKCPVVDINYNNNEINYGDVNNAMLVEPRPECVADGIIKLLEDDELRNIIAENGYKYVESFPDIEGSLSKLEQILRGEVSCRNNDNMNDNMNDLCKYYLFPYLARDNMHMNQNNVNIKDIRKYYLSNEITLYKPFLLPKVIPTLDEIVYDSDFLGATDPSALSLIAMIIKVCQSKKILQLGTYIGFSAIALGGVLSTSTKGGMIYTVDINKSKHIKARYYAKKAGLENIIRFIDGSSTDPDIAELLAKYGPFDLIFIDSSHAYQHTLDELKIYVEGERFTASSTLVMLHDAGEDAKDFDPTHEGGVRGALEEWIELKNNKRKYQLFIFEPPMYPNPCGLAIVRKL